jgi:hypothetical protein
MKITIKETQNPKIVKFELDSLNYNLRVPKDSLCLIVVNPVLHTSNNVKVHWPFKKRRVLIPISSSQIILYNFYFKD